MLTSWTSHVVDHGTTVSWKPQNLLELDTRCRDTVTLGNTYEMTLCRTFNNFVPVEQQRWMLQFSCLPRSTIKPSRV